MTNNIFLHSVYKSSYTPSFILYPDYDFKILSVNNNLLNILNIEETQLLQKRFFELLYQFKSVKDADLIKSLKVALEQVLNTNTFNNFVIKNSAPEGNYLDGLNIHITPISEKYGVIEYLYIQFIGPTPIIGEFFSSHHDEKSSSIKTAEARDFILASVKLKKMLDKSIDVICTISREGYFMDVSAASESVWGYHPSEMIGSAYIDYVEKYDITKYKQIAEAILLGEDLVNFENKFIKKDGTILPILWTAKWDEEDKLFYCTAKNIFLRKSQENSLLSSEQRFKKLVQDGSDLIAILDDKANYIYCSPTSFKIIGIEAELFIGKNAFDFIHPEDKPWVFKIFENIADDKIFTIPPYRFKDGKGKWKWIETAITYLLDDPDIKGIIANSRDITDRINRELKLKESEEKYKMLFQNGPLSKIVYDANTLNIQDVNNTGLLFFGYSKTEMLTMSLRELISYKNKGISPYNKHDTPDTFFHGVKTLLKKDGSHVKVELSTQGFNYQGITYGLLLCNDVTEKEEALSKLKENETKLIAAQHIAKIGYWKLNLLTNELFWSDEIYRIWQKDKNSHKIHQDTFLDSVHPEDRTAFDHMIKATLEGAAGKELEHRIILENGTTKWVHQRGNIIKNSIGESIIFEGTVQDISERKFAEQELLISEARHRGLVESQSHYVIRVDLNSNYSFVNKKFVEDFGWLFKGENILGKNALLSTKDYHHQRIIDVIGKCLQYPNEIFKVELDKHTPTGETITTLWDFTCLTDANGNPTEFQSMGTDITSRIKVELELQESKKRYEYVIQATSDAIWDWDLKTDYVFIAAGFFKNFGYNVDNFNASSKSWTDLIHPNDKERVKASIEKSLNGSDSVWESEYRYKKANGFYTYVHDRGTIIRDSKGQAIRMVGASKDISKEKITKLEAQLKLDLKKIFSEKSSLEKAYEQTLYKILSYRDLPYGELWITTYDQSRLILAAHYGSGIKLSESEKVSLKITEGLSGLVWANKKFQLISNIQKSKIYFRKEFAKNHNLHSAIAYPIMVNETVLGVIILYKNSDNDFEDGFSLSHHILDQIATDIQNKKAQIELNLFFDLSSDLMCIAGFDGYFKKINYAFETALGYSRAVILNTPFINFVHPDYVESTNETLGYLSQGLKVSYFETRYKTIHGNYIWLAWTSTPLEKEGLIFAIAKDITEKKTQEELLARSNKQVADILESIQDGFIALDKNWNITYWNNEAERLLGKKQKDVLGILFWDLFPDILNSKIHRNHIKLLEKQVSVRFEEYYQPLERWIDTSVFPSEQGLTIYFKDITDKKLAELELIQFKKIIESSKECIGIIHTNKKTSYINKAFSDQMGYDSSEVRKLENSLDLYPNKELAMEIFSKIINGEHWQGDIDLINKNGSETPFYLSAGPIYNDNGEFIAAFGIHTNISERKHAEKELNQLNESLIKQTKELAISNAELEQFAYVASHDLQEPLRMISSFLTQIKKKYDPLLDEKGRQYIHFASDGAQRMKQIIIDLLSYSRVGRMEEPLEYINLNELVIEIKALLKRQIEELGAVIEYERLPVILSLKTPLRHLFLNLIENGLKYQNKGNIPWIKITCVDSSAHWHFTIKDNGIGISSEYFDKIFVIFQRLHHKEEFSGSGMGLAICKKSVEYLGGKIWVESEEGKGSSFHWTILKSIP